MNIITTKTEKFNTAQGDISFAVKQQTSKNIQKIIKQDIYLLPKDLDEKALQEISEIISKISDIKTTINQSIDTKNIAGDNTHTKSLEFWYDKLKEKGLKISMSNILELKQVKKALQRKTIDFYFQKFDQKEEINEPMLNWTMPFLQDAVDILEELLKGDGEDVTEIVEYRERIATIKAKVK